jgi:Tfp pilus assembly protein PilF
MLGSRKRLVGASLFAVLLAFSVAMAQGQGTDLENHFKRLPDGSFRFSNESGTSINQDYYLDPNKPPPDSSLLWIVERYHMGQKEWDQLAAGQYEGALNDVLYTLRRFPNHPTALMMIGIIGKATKQNDMAVKYFEHATTIYPQYGHTHALYGKYLLDVGAFEASIKKLNLALEKDAKMGKAHGWMAEAYAKNGQMDLALEAARRAREVGYRGRISGVREKK